MDATELQLLLLAGASASLALAQRRQLMARADALVRPVLTWIDCTICQAPRRGPGTLPSPDPDRLLGGPEQVKAGKVTARAWVGMLNDDLTRHPHTLVVGPTGAGKTTFATALLAYRAGEGVVLTPKPDPTDTWGGLPVVTIDDAGTFGELTAAFEDLWAEVRRRLVAAKHGQPVGELLTVVCDDWPVLAAECGAPAVAFFKNVARLGRSLRVRLIVLSQSERVKALGLEGEGDAVTNFARVVLSRGHTCMLYTEGVELPLDLQPVLAMARIAKLGDRGARVLRGSTAGADRLPAEALGVEPRPAETGEASSSTVSQTSPNEQTNERTALADAAGRLPNERTRSAVVATLVAAGWGTTAIRELLRGTAEDIGAEVRIAREALDSRAHDPVKG